MKVQIIYLDLHDDYVSALDKLAGAKAPRVLLVWPRHGRILTRKLDLVLLHRNAQQRGYQIGVITHDPDVRANASEVGIAVFDSLDKLPEERWHARRRSRAKKERQREPPKLDLLTPPSTRNVFMLGGVWNNVLRFSLATLAILALLVVIATIVPSADIEINPQTRTQELEILLTIDSNVDQPQPDGRIPATWQRVSLDGFLRKPTSGSIALPDQKASGSVVFTNLTSEGVEIPSGTGVRPSGESDIRFITTETADLPDRKGSEVEVRIEAATSGSVGNLPAGAIDAVEGSLGLSVAVVNPDFTAGGTESDYAAVSILDRIELERELTSQLLEQAEALLLEDLAPNQILLPNSVHTSQIVERSYNREVGDPAESLALNMVIEIEGAAYTIEDLETAARLALDGDLQAKQSSVPNSLLLQGDDIEITAEVGTLRIQATQEIFETIDLGRLQMDLRGKTKEDANDYLSSRLDLISDPVIHISPEWFPRLPWIGIRINIYYTWELDP